MRARDGRVWVCIAVCAALAAILPSAAIAAPGDATATQVANINPGAGSSLPSFLTNVDGLLFFNATEPVLGTELWKSTGGPLGAGGTQPVSNITGDAGDSNPGEFTNIGGTVLFRAQDASGDAELWKSVPPYNAASTTLVENIGGGMASSNPIGLTNVGGTLLFAANANDGTGVELWKSAPPFDSGSTSLVEDINQTMSTSSFPDVLTDVNGTLFFQADDGLNGTELWKSASPFDAASTSLVKDIDPGDDTPAGGGPDSSFPDDLTNVGGTLLFSASDGVNATELWKSVGPNYNAGSTSMVENINTASDSNPSQLANVAGALFFSADDTTHGAELWKSTSPFNAANTDIVQNIFPGASPSSPEEIIDVNGTAFFRANDGTNGNELWKSGGTGPTTTLVANINPTGSSSTPADLTAVGGQVFFRATNATSGIELWKSAGTGATLVRDINPLAANSTPVELTDVNGTLFFRANDGSTGIELWKATIEPTPPVVTPVTPAPTPTPKKKCKKKKKGKKGAAVAKKCKKKKKK
jgi:ELWxxDGT repeat protein